MIQNLLVSLSTMVVMTLSSPAIAKTSRWTTAEAATWSQQSGWAVGANFIPKSAVNQLEMWQAATFDPKEIEVELSVAEATGLTSARVFLHDLVWQQDQKGFADRIDQFLTIAARHGIKPIFVLFDSCWNPSPKLGPQPNPVPGVHNSGWVQSPGLSALMDAHQTPRLRNYIRGVIKRFRKDSRILAWDLWNEPDNLNSSSSNDSHAKIDRVAELIPLVFDWARSADPIQPLTSGVWAGDWSDDSKLTSVRQTQLSQSDIISFHSYEQPVDFARRIASLRRFQRPIFCTEYMARPLGSIIQTILPIAKTNSVSAYNWGFVAGRTQTYFPWDSWEKPYAEMPAVWFHDLFQSDLTPYDQTETAFIKQITQPQK